MRGEKAVGLFIVNKGVIKEYKKLKKRRRSTNYYRENEEKKEEKEEKKEGSIKIVSGRLRNRKSKRSGLFMKPSFGRSRKFILGEIGKNHFSLDLIKSPLFLADTKIDNRHLNVEYLIERDIEFNDKDVNYKPAWELEKIIRKGRTLGMNDLLKSKRFTYTYSTGDSGTELFYIDLHHFSSLIEKRFRLQQNSLKELMKETVFCGIENTALIDHLVFDFREIELKKGALVYKKGHLAKFVYILIEGSVEIINFVRMKPNLPDVYEYGKSLLHKKGSKAKNMEILKSLDRSKIIKLKKNSIEMKKIVVSNVGLNQLFGELESLEKKDDQNQNESIDVKSFASSEDSDGADFDLGRRKKIKFFRRQFSAVATSQKIRLLRIHVEIFRLRMKVFGELGDFVKDRIERKKELFKEKTMRMKKFESKKKEDRSQQSYKYLTYTRKKINPKFCSYKNRIKKLKAAFGEGNKELQISHEYNMGDVMENLDQLKISLRLTMERQKLNKFKTYYQSVKEQIKKNITLRKKRMIKEREDYERGDSIEENLESFEAHLNVSSMELSDLNRIDESKRKNSRSKKKMGRLYKKPLFRKRNLKNGKFRSKSSNFLHYLRTGNDTKIKGNLEFIQIENFEDKKIMTEKKKKTPKLMRVQSSLGLGKKEEQNKKYHFFKKNYKKERRKKTVAKSSTNFTNYTVLKTVQDSSSHFDQFLTESQIFKKSLNSNFGKKLKQDRSSYGSFDAVNDVYIKRRARENLSVLIRKSNFLKKKRRKRKNIITGSGIS